MARRADPERVLEALGDDAAIVQRWAAELVGDGARWPRIPALRILAETLAAVRLADAVADIEPSTAASVALERACDALGLEDDSDAATSPASTVGRRIRVWLAKAWPELSSGHRRRKRATLGL